MNINYQQIPNEWPVCFLNECKFKAQCLRYLAGQTVPNDVKTIETVMPAMVKQDACTMFRKVEKVHVALGFSKIFKDVKACHIARMRAEMAYYLGGKSTFYRYSHGERALSPEQQTWIRDLFLDYGYNEEVNFDNYAYRFRFYDDCI